MISIAPGLAVLVLIIAGELGYLLCGWLRDRRTRAAAAAADESHERDLAMADWRVAERLFAEALDAFADLPVRLHRLADVAEHRAAVWRKALRHGAVSNAPPQPGAVSYDPPVGLARTSSRFPPVVQWQRFDRAFAAFTAIESDRDRTLARRISALTELAVAARQLADAIPDEELSFDVAVCGFCGRPAERARRITGGRSAIVCDECIVELADQLQSGRDDT